MTDVIQVKRRDSIGTGATRRLRRSGHIPAVLYGHGESNEHLAIPEVQVRGLLRHHSKTVQLEGDVRDTALVSEMQWDALGIEVLHLDLIRVNLKEKVEVTVPVHLQGEAVGTHEGGMLLENTHEVDIRCPA
ncbi:MAG: 50S ribosomal protein L25, partial [Planctomycetota bacterium]